MVIGARLNLAELREEGIAEDDIKDSDKDGNFLITGEGYYLAVKHVWAKVFGAVHADPVTGNRAMLDDYISDNKWDWSRLLTPSYDMLETYLSTLKHTGLGKDGILNFCWKYGNADTTGFLFRLLDAHFANDVRPDDINEMLKIFSLKKRTKTI